MTYYALSIWQPWAWLIVNGYKDIENRHWRSNYRGPLLIHAAKNMDDLSLEEIVQLYNVPINPDEITLERGGIVGRVNMVDCIESSQSKWFHGKFGFVLQNQEAIPFKPYRGQQGIFKVTL